MVGRSHHTGDVVVALSALRRPGVLDLGGSGGRDRGAAVVAELTEGRGHEAVARVKRRGDGDEPEDAEADNLIRKFRYSQAPPLAAQASVDAHVRAAGWTPSVL